MELYWKGYKWMNGQPWGVAHTNKNHVWYADEKETWVVNSFEGKDGEFLKQSINNEKKYFKEIERTKEFGCGCISSYDRFRYGDFHFEYKLPKGTHLWPAIWLSGWDSWPPEIDIVEGWSGNGYFFKNKPNYKRFPLFNNIHPGVFYTTDENRITHGKGYGSFGSDKATYSWLQKTDKWNSCDLKWRKDLIEVYYNKKCVMRIDENTQDRGYRIMDFMNKDMYVCIDLFAGDNFTQKDYEEYQNIGSNFVIREFTYKFV